MENIVNINSDPQQYREEWFDVAVSLAKEFKLPNLSCPLFRCSLIDHSKNVNYLAINTNPVASTRPAILVENRQVTATSTLMYTRNQTQVQVSDSLSSNNNNNFPVENKQACVHCLSNSSPDFHPSGSHFSNFGRNNPWSCPDQNPRSNFNNSNATIANISYKPPHGTAWSCTSSESYPNMIGLPISCGSSNCLFTYIKKEPETLDINDQNLIKPEQKIQDINGGDQKIIKNRISEPQSDDSDHKCIICRRTFANGNALGGHMSSHAKKRKIEAMKDGGILISRADPFDGSSDQDEKVDKEEEDTRGYLTTESVASDGEKIDESVPSSQVDNDDDERSRKTDADEEEDESYSPPKVA